MVWCGFWDGLGKAIGMVGDGMDGIIFLLLVFFGSCLKEGALEHIMRGSFEGACEDLKEVEVERMKWMDACMR